MLITEGLRDDRLAPMGSDQVVAGIDWARDDHAIAVVDAAGQVVEQFTVDHTAAGLRELRRLAGIRYCGSTTPEKMHARITAAPRGAGGDTGAAAVHVTRALLAVLRALVEQIDVLTDQIAEQLHSHADAHVFTSLPRAGTVRAARLLAEIGDARGRFPTPEALASLAGVAPATRQSGKSRIVGFRWAVDRQLRDALVSGPVIPG